MGRHIEDRPPGHSGHRVRLRNRVLTAGPESLADYELLEFLLFGALPRKDTKPLAKALIQRFGSLAGAVSADPAALRELDGMGDAAIAVLRATRETATRMTREDLLEAPVLSSWDKLLEHCRVVMGRDAVEQFRVLFLDRKNRLIADEQQQKGTVDHTPVYPREILKRALELGASAMILVHNHPSGDPTPSPADIAMTREIVAIAEGLGIAVHDHVIIARAGQASFRALNLLK